MTSYKNNNVISLCIMGDGGVGKTAVTIQFISNHFVYYYDPTIEDSYRKQCLVDDQVYMLDILDTAGQDELTAMRDQWIRSCEGFILVYSVTSRSSFDQIQFFREQIIRVLDSDDVPIMMIGNKIDLDDERQVTFQEGKDLARCLGMSFMEVSAKNRTNVEEVFNETVRIVKRKEDPQSHKPSKDSDSKKPLVNTSKIIKKINTRVKQTKTSICKMM
ncbi:Ras GTPase [Dictyostelium discoideum AX4]|uniref:Ras-like protein rasW n=1 Tax=Dictyostelium discoideum TaxID=44689 RepID=RASW_DICDI|nr:Ras GTPase [Dictyostelium discoideum AX4]Q55CC0.1 RecName: Full=Ras-like protein rasW; Flags: Precursor [Dictyostelium discoideum]EAL72411.1 Ras GTPase [Dictyostelium discoideum AX4]|eukprot:XP_646561.1 Ras GTPase [Dictyostelium discoideum AX4]